MALDATAVDPRRVVSRFAGVRVLPLASGPTSRTRRDAVISRGPAGMVSVAGGKLTTWRAIGSRAALLALSGRAGHRRPARASLPGAASPALVEEAIQARYPALPSHARAALARHHGLLALDVLALSTDDPTLLEFVHPDAPELWAEVVYARDREWAATARDVLHNRTTLALRGLDTPELAARIARRLEAP
jgi:glycerol-3-phosphate dehydrogenase